MEIHFQLVNTTMQRIKANGVFDIVLSTITLHYLNKLFKEYGLLEIHFQLVNTTMQRIKANSVFDIVLSTITLHLQVKPTTKDAHNKLQ